ncbi:hypothetical protein M0811_00620 [Anaeramoeba ignava]|uniref:Uncharacterized protein n=1 Tax=Anaeramoeba ignava TaxID=1746090 RepID=A0A9Q0LU40_ANAIG|nr:hypothetical protein M0811_00620 [Anaeramoeba ignava]
MIKNDKKNFFLLALLAYFSFFIFHFPSWKYKIFELIHFRFSFLIRLHANLFASHFAKRFPKNIQLFPLFNIISTKKSIILHFNYNKLD